MRIRRLRWALKCWLSSVGAGHAAAGRRVGSGLSLAAALVGCGGGITIGFGSGTQFDDAPPSISLAASSGSVVAGQSVLLTADAADTSGIDVVAFFRLDPGVQVPLGTIARPPYRLSVTAPADGRSVLQVFARAIDNVGKRSDSELVEIVITR